MALANPCPCALCGHEMRTYSDGSERCVRDGCGFQVSPAVVKTAEALARIECSRRAKREYLPPLPMPTTPSPINLNGRPTPSNGELIAVGIFIGVGVAAFLGGALVRVVFG